MEKIMRLVKSGNKKRGRNITVGAVVGMLLSCTAVMGANEYLWIKNDGKIKFSTDNSTPTNIENPYGENTWNGTDYVNNITLNSTSTDYGLKLEGDLGSINFTNNGLIRVTRNGASYGIYNSSSSKIGNIENNGSITGISTGSSEACGIYNKGTMGNITNRGLIIETNTGSDSGYGICNDFGSSKIENIINSGLIAGIGKRSSKGIWICGGTNINSIYNIGLIIGAGDSNQGIYIQGNIAKDLINDGVISSLDLTSSVSNHVIYIYEKTPIIKNNGLMIGRKNGSEGAYGIFNQTTAGRHIRAINTGSIINTNDGTGNAAGIRNINGSANDFYIANSGLISGATTGSGNGYGIYNESNATRNNYAEIEAIVNTGVIYGETTAIKNLESKATITSIDNYGILATEGNSSIDNTTGGTITNTPTNYGLYIEGTTGIVTIDPSKVNASPIDIVVSYSNDDDYVTNEIKRNMTIKNADLEGTSGSAIATKSIIFSGAVDEFKNFILNGKDKTLKVSGTDREVKEAIINAYGTAVVFDGTDSQLTLSGTIVNGGADGKAAVSGSGNGDTLILQSEEIEYVGGTKETQNTIINGNIDMLNGNNKITLKKGSAVNGIITTGTGADTIAIENGAIINGSVKMGAGEDVLNIVSGGKINGTLDGGADNDTLNFNPETTKALGNNEINIQHNISDFETININTNVTLFEKTIVDDGSIEKLAVSGVNEINISAGSVLNLRIDTTETNGRYEGHALFGNTALTINGDAGSLGEGESITESENGIYNVGVLNLVTNGLGKNSIIAMDGITLDEDLFTKTNSILDKAVILKTDEGNGKAGDIRVEADKDIFREVKTSSQKYEKLNDIYNGVISSTDDNFIALKNIITINSKTEDYTSVTDSEQLAKLLDYLGNIYTGSPYSYSSELSRRSVGMFRDIVTENEFKPELNKWMIMGGLTHADGGTKDTYYGRNYHGFDTGTSNTKADMKLTGAYMLAKYGYSENLSLGLTLGGNKSEAEMSMSKVKGNSGYIGAFAEKYRGNLTLKAGAGIQYSEYDADRRTVGENYSEKYSDMTYDIYLNGRYSHQVGDNLFLEPYGTLSYTYIDQDGANEGSKTLAIETDSKSFDYTAAKVGVDLKKVIPHEKGKSTLSAGVSYTKILDGADEEHITGRFKGGSDFDILVAHKNEHSIGLNAKYALELENGILFDVKGTYSVERDSNNNSGKNRTKGEWIAGAGLGYKF